MMSTIDSGHLANTPPDRQCRHTGRLLFQSQFSRPNFSRGAVGAELIRKRRPRPIDYADF